MIGDPSEILKRAIEAVKLLAVGYELQLGTLPESVHRPDEIALIYGDLFLLLDHVRTAGLISDSVYSDFQSLNGLLDRMSDDKELWTLESLRSRQEWSHVRSSAKGLLKKLGAPEAPPDLYWEIW